jgi:bacterial leucyl aminopeptidase
VIPFEATLNSMNHDIHTGKDKLNSKLSFKHSMAFSKLALGFAMELAGSNWRETP